MAGTAGDATAGADSSSGPQAFVDVPSAGLTPDVMPMSAASPTAPEPSPANLRHDETLFQAMRVLDSAPTTTQRQLAQRLGLSLGMANYCLQALAAKGWVKMESFRNSRNKLAYSYILTPRGMAEKATLTAHFLQRKMREYERLQAEIEQLRREASPQTPPGSADRSE